MSRMSIAGEFEAMRRKTENTPKPDRVTSSGKRIWDKSPTEYLGSGVYFAGAQGANLVKIGWVSKIDKIEQRLDRVRTDCPYPVQLLLTVNPASRLHEGRLHKHFDQLRFHGEWFKYEGELKDILEVSAQDEASARAALRNIYDVRF